MAEYIDRNELVKNLDRFAPEHLTPLIRSLIEKQPTADVEEVKHGHWIPIPYNTTKPYPYECNRCGRVADREYEYCHCGAKMDGGVNDG